MKNFIIIALITLAVILSIANYAQAETSLETTVVTSMTCDEVCYVTGTDEKAQITRGDIISYTIEV